jgi:RND family efflux transporter MFP subunit
MTRIHWSAAGMFGMLAACSGDRPLPPPVPVTIALVGSETGHEEARYSGVFKADESVEVAFRVSGIVEAITQVRGADGRLRGVQDGDRVHQGMVLARLRQTEFRDQVMDADAALRQARADFERASHLYENRSISRAEYDAAYARYTSSTARRSQANLALGDATLRAPREGVILRRTVEAGSLAGPGVPAFTIADTRVMKVVFGVPDVAVAGLRLGDTLAILAEALPGVDLKGRVTLIASSADPASRVFEVEAVLPNHDQRLRVGMLATLRMPGRADESGLVVPLDAVVRPPDDSTGYAVYVVDEQPVPTARLRPVRLGGMRGAGIVVRDGLRSGERVVVQGATIVTDGQAVRVTP